jgi:NAD(P)-dependent dehydrogenase (short-subunit alcohol dehydrogenase family)
MDARNIVLITGANTGLGYEIVRALCASEVAYELLVGGRSLAKAEQAIQAASSEFPTTRSHLRPIQIDLEDDSSINSAFQLVHDAYGKIDALINNGGRLTGHLSSISPYSANQYSLHTKALNWIAMTLYLP